MVISRKVPKNPFFLQNAVFLVWFEVVFAFSEILFENTKYYFFSPAALRETHFLLGEKTMSSEPHLGDFGRLKAWGRGQLFELRFGWV